MVDAIGSKFKDYAPLFLRLGLGVIFLISGVRDVLRLEPSPPLWSAVGAVLQILCGLMVLVGWLTRWGAAGLAVLLIVWIAHDPNRLHVITRREHQWMFAYLVMSLALFGLGGGKCSMDLRKKRREGT